jgi:uncharacterized protein (UPF0332 family)
MEKRNTWRYSKMLKASKHVDWCLKKAQDEILECERLGKSRKHRGLLEIKPSIELAKKHVQKAEHDLNAVNYLLKGNYQDISISMIFYSMYHCFLAIAAKFGYESRNQSCTISLMEHLKLEGKIQLDDKYLDMFKYADIKEQHHDSIIEMREEFTYGIETSVDNKKDILEKKKECRDLIEITKKIIY